jgi:hypothetical protein
MPAGTWTSHSSAAIPAHRYRHRPSRPGGSDPALLTGRDDWLTLKVTVSPDGTGPQERCSNY